MTDFIMTELKIDAEAATALRRRFFQQHGTTLRGLMNDYGMAPTRFLEYVHEIDLSSVSPDPELTAALTALPGRKLVFTNGTVAHAERVLARLGLGEHFCGIHDIVSCNYVPKPDPSGYRSLIERHGIAPARTAMVEDMAKNLAPAAALGMTTVWVKGGPHAVEEDGALPHIHYVVERLGSWLATATRRPDAAPAAIPAAE
jgi:putative hydrolase of the HAD superfamily